MDKQVFTITLKVTLDPEAWATEYGIEPTAEAVRADFIGHAAPNFTTTTGEGAPTVGDVVPAWDGLVTRIIATAK